MSNEIIDADPTYLRRMARMKENDFPHPCPRRDTREDWEKEADEEIAEIIKRERKRKRIERFFQGYCFG